MKRFEDLTEQEILALAVSSEEEDSQIYMSFSNRLRDTFPATAQMFEDMAMEEQDHKNMLLDVFRRRVRRENALYHAARRSWIYAGEPPSGSWTT
jgi:rubrerythrin